LLEVHFQIRHSGKMRLIPGGILSQKLRGGKIFRE